MTIFDTVHSDDLVDEGPSKLAGIRLVSIDQGKVDNRALAELRATIQRRRDNMTIDECLEILSAGIFK